MESLFKIVSLEVYEIDPAEQGLFRTCAMGNRVA